MYHYVLRDENGIRVPCEICFSLIEAVEAALLVSGKVMIHREHANGRSEVLATYVNGRIA